MTRSRYRGNKSGRSTGDGISNSVEGSEYLTNYGQRPLKKPVIPTYVNNFGVGEWASGGSTITTDSVNYAAGPNALKFTRKAQAGTQAIELATPLAHTVDWTGTHIYVRFYMYEGSGVSSYANISTIKMALIDDEGASDSKAFNLYASGVDARSGPGWHEAAFTIEESWEVETGTFNPALVDRIRFEIAVTTEGTDTPAVTFDQILAFPKPADTTVMVRFDDGFGAQYDMVTYANALGIPVTLGIIKENVDAADAGGADLTTSQLQLFQDAGNLIVNHSINSSSADMTGLSDADFRRRIVEQQQWMCEKGFSRGSRIFIVPQGKLLNSQIRILEQLVDFIWWAEDDGRATSGSIGQGIAIDYDRLYCSAFEGQKAGRDTAALDAKLAQAVTSKGVYCPFWHADTLTNYEGHIDQIATDFAAGNIVVTTPDRYINRAEKLNDLLVNDVQISGALNHDGSSVGFYGEDPIAQAVLATGGGATVDNVITALQNLGLVKQS